MGAVNQAVEGRASLSREWTHTPRNLQVELIPPILMLELKPESVSKKEAPKATISQYYHVISVAAPPQAGLQRDFFEPLQNAAFSLTHPCICHCPLPLD